VIYYGPIRMTVVDGVLVHVVLVIHLDRFVVHFIIYDVIDLCRISVKHSIMLTG
jgi:hypothetical protein